MEVHVSASSKKKKKNVGGSLGLHRTPIGFVGGADGYKWAIVGPKCRAGSGGGVRSPPTKELPKLPPISERLD